MCHIAPIVLNGLLMWYSTYWNVCLRLFHAKDRRWLIGLFVSEEMKNSGTPRADSCALCATQTPLRLNHRLSSMWFCPTRDITFSCHWATSSPPSCFWCSLSSSSSSSHADVKPKVCSTSIWQQMAYSIFFFIAFSPKFLLFSEFYPQASIRWVGTHTHHHRLNLRHTLTLRCLSLSLW